jgi:hypothetical protein
MKKIKKKKMGRRKRRLWRYRRGSIRRKEDWKRENAGGKDKNFKLQSFMLFPYMQSS